MIRLRSITLAATSALIATVAFAGCGSSGDSGFNGDGNGGGGGGGGQDPGNGGGIGGGIGDPDGGTSGPPTDPGPIVGCGNSTKQAQLIKVNLITMFDRSWSMEEGGAKAARWDPVTKGMATFYADKGSGGMSASLQFFPRGGDICPVGNYNNTTGGVGLTALPDTKGAFKNSMDANEPDSKANTPTTSALQGAVDVAEATQKAKPAEKTVVLFVTDGEPNDSCGGCDRHGCHSTTVDDAVAVAKTAHAPPSSLSTYVIGVGPQAAAGGAIDQIATGGGTTGIHVNVDNPDQTSAQLVAALQKLRGDLIPCSLPIPPPKDGHAIDYNALRVNFTSSKGVAQTIPYSEACAGGVGWHYDVKTAPKNIVLCPAPGKTCPMVQADPGGVINIVYDCHGDPVDGGGPPPPIH